MASLAEGNPHAPAGVGSTARVVGPRTAEMAARAQNAIQGIRVRSCQVQGTMPTSCDGSKKFQNLVAGSHKHLTSIAQEKPQVPVTALPAVATLLQLSVEGQEWLQACIPSI